MNIAIPSTKHNNRNSTLKHMLQSIFRKGEKVNINGEEVDELSEGALLRRRNKPLSNITMTRKPMPYNPTSNSNIVTLNLNPAFEPTEKGGKTRKSRKTKKRRKNRKSKRKQ